MKQRDRKLVLLFPVLGGLSLVASVTNHRTIALSVLGISALLLIWMGYQMFKFEPQPKPLSEAELRTSALKQRLPITFPVNFEPQPDITAYELALILELFTCLGSCEGALEFIDEMPRSYWRHIKQLRELDAQRRDTPVQQLIGQRERDLPFTTSQDVAQELEPESNAEKG